VTGGAGLAYGLVDGLVGVAGDVTGDGDDGIEQRECVVAGGAGRGPLR